jgi:hypothetical protein
MSSFRKASVAAVCLAAVGLMGVEAEPLEAGKSGRRI